MQTTRDSSLVYWIRLQDHSDVLSEGYVGITSLGLEKRYSLHKSAAKRLSNTSIIARAIRKYGDNLVVEPVVFADIGYCRDVENRLRPAKNTGWNIGVGGSGTRRGQTNSPEHIAKFRAKVTGKKRTKETIETFRANGLKQMTFEHPWEHPYVNLKAWTQAAKAEQLIAEGAGQRTVASQLQVGRDSAVKLVQRLKAGWKPLEDTEYCKWLASQSIKEDHG